jgi:hypothetical protein
VVTASASFLVSGPHGSKPVRTARLLAVQPAGRRFQRRSRSSRT